MKELSVEARHHEGVILLYPRGYINAHTVRLFEDELRRALEQGCYKIVLNGSDLAYIASAGLGALMGVIEEIRSNGGDLRLSELNDTVVNILEILGLHHLYQIFPSELEAVASFQEGREAAR